MNDVRIFDDLFRTYEGSRFSVRLWDGETRSYGRGERDAFVLIIKSEEVFRELLTRGALGFGEAYMDGTLEIEGDLEAYLRVRHRVKSTRKTWRLKFAAFIAHLQMPHRRERQISYHYDIGNEFFSRILDRETMSYSAGMFNGAANDFPRAQQEKLRFLAEWLALAPGARVLDLGSGWGGFIRHGAAERGWNMAGYSLSRKQLDYIREHLGGKYENAVELNHRDMMSLAATNRFDGVVSIESIEHVGKAYLGDFFRRVHDALKPGGYFALQLTGRSVPRRVDSWTLKYVFPGGYLPAKGELLVAAREAGFEVKEFRDDTADYLKTMVLWIENLERARGAIIRDFGESHYRLWELWMHGAKVAFEEEYMSLFRVRLVKPAAVDKSVSKMMRPDRMIAND